MTFDNWKKICRIESFDVNGYVGSSTSKEILYAKKTNKSVREAYINNNDKSTKHKNLYLLWVILGVLLDSSGLIVIVGFIFLEALLIIFHPIFN